MSGLKVMSDVIVDGKVTLKPEEEVSTSKKIATFDDNGVITFRTLQNIKSDLGPSGGGVTPEELNAAVEGKLDKLTEKPSAGTFTKLTINTEGQVTGGAALASSDIPMKVQTLTSESLSAGANAITFSELSNVLYVELYSGDTKVLAPFKVSGNTVTVQASDAITVDATAIGLSI